MLKWREDSADVVPGKEIPRRISGSRVGVDVIGGRKPLVLTLPMHHHKSSELFSLYKMSF